MGPYSGLGERLLRTLDGVELSLKSQVHSLGVLLVLALVLENHAAAAGRSAFYQLKLICHLRPGQINHALVMCCM